MQAASTMPEPAPNTVAVNEADSNADTCCLGKNFIPLQYTNKSADVYPYHDAYKPLENVPIVSAATAFDHHDGNTYILVIHEALYYGTKMNHSLINPNQIRFNGLDFFDNPTRDEEIYFEADESLHIPMNFKGTKCVFTSRVPTPDELHQYEHFHLTSSRDWNPSEVDLRAMYRVAAVEKKRRTQVFSVKVDEQFSSSLPFTFHIDNVFAYQDPVSDVALLYSISPSLVSMKEMMISFIRQDTRDNEFYPSRRTFVNYDRQAKLTAESLAELWHIGIKRARNTLQASNTKWC